MFPRAKTGRPGKDSRLIFNAILWIVCSGAPWRDLPERFGSWKTVYSRFCKWRNEGTLFRVFEDLKKDSDYEGSSEQCGSKKGAKGSEVGQHIGKSSCGRTTKIHAVVAVVDGFGNPLYIGLTAGQVHDSRKAVEILSQLNI